VFVTEGPNGGTGAIGLGNKPRDSRIEPQTSIRLVGFWRVSQGITTSAEEHRAKGQKTANT
jgi:hypothetical protein